MSDNALMRLETIDWPTNEWPFNGKREHYPVSLIGYFTEGRVSELEGVIRSRWQNAGHRISSRIRELLDDRETDFVPVFRYGEPLYSSSVSSMDSMIYTDTTGSDEKCVQLPLPQFLMPPIERRILIAESLGLPQLSDMQREELQREIAALRWNHSRLYEARQKRAVGGFLY